ncbi:MAG TPA: TRAP transporter substrate-binding protein [Beijerinckiaceae bacterium]|jgi:TRAP-type C4-dicarboxylate transport system substrate-binding protein
MTIPRRRFLALAGGAVAAPAVLREGYAQAPQVTLKLHHLLPPVANVPVHFLVPWAKKVEQESHGRIRIEIYPAMQLGGAPPQLYDQARDGVVDLVWTVLGYTAGRFPRSEVIENPFISHRTALVNSLAIQELYEKHIADEFSEVHPICVFAHDRGLIHANRRIERMEDMKGAKLRFPSRLAGDALKALGASAIGMPVSQVPEAIAQRAIDGAVVPWEVVPAVKLDELVKFHSEIAGAKSFYTIGFILAMNKARYASLPADLKRVIDNNSGQAAARMAAVPFDRMAVEVPELVKRKGGTIVTVAEAEAQRWQKTTQPVIDNWIRQVKDRNVDGGKLLDTVRELIAKYEKAA